MDAELQNRAKALFDYLHEVVKLGLKVVRNVDEHDDFLLFQPDLPQADGITLFTTSNDDVSWLTIYRQTIPNPPELPDVLKDWVEVPNDPDREPQVIKSRQIDNNIIEFSDDKAREEAFNKYREAWQSWRVEAEPKKKAQDLFTKLFHLGNRLKYDEQLELIWGQGLLLWKYDYGHEIKYPLITQRLIIDHNARKGIIRVFPPDDAEPQLELDSLTDLEIPDLSEVKKYFKEIEYNPSDPTSYSNILKELAGRLSTDGRVVRLSETKDFTPTIKLRIVDCWILFARKRQQDAIIRDIRAFQNKLKMDEVTLLGGLLPFLRVSRGPDKTPRAEPKSHDEWNTLTDKRVLFPLPANQEQIQVLDCIEQANGVVVWGPPGTGKSHTIANLISHFMAEGKRVLVTTLKDHALAVLHDMIPEDLKPLCISMLSTVRDSRKKLEEAVTTINEVVTQGRSQSHVLRKEIIELENEIDRYREDLVTIQRKIRDLAQIQHRGIMSLYGEILLAADLVKKMQKDEARHSWLKDVPPYKEESSVHEGEDITEITAELPILPQELEELKHLRRTLLQYLEDFSCELPAVVDLVDDVTFNGMREGLQKMSLLEEDINQLMHGLIFKDNCPEKLGQALDELKQGIETNKLISEDWQRSLLEKIRTSPLETERIKEASAVFDDYVKKITELFLHVDPLKSIVLGNASIGNLRTFVTEAINAVKRGKKPWGFFGQKKRILKAIKVNNEPPSTEKDWEDILCHIDLLHETKKLRSRWNALACDICAPQLNETGETTKQEAKTLLCLIDRFNAPIKFETICLPGIKKAIGQIIVGAEKILSENSLERIYGVISIKKEQQHFASSKALLERLKGKLQQLVSSERPHPVVREMVDCLNNISGETNIVVESWRRAYQKVKTLEAIRNEYNRFNELLNKLKEYAPNWASDWKRRDVQENDLCPHYWQESWQFQALKKYLQDISDATQKITELEKKQEELIKGLTRKKEKLVLSRTKLSLISNISDAHLNALERWRLAVRKLGKGKSKWAWRKEKVVQQEMSHAQSAVPVWIMPLYKVSETIPSEFGSFDVVIVDEASQCDVRAFLAVARGEKVIVVGDPEQISPAAVGIPEVEIQKLIKEFLGEIPGGHFFDLRTSLYDTAKITFSGQGTLMLREHFRCIPEIIQFNNELCYQGKILPLRNPPPAQRLEPVLENVFVEGGYREGRQDINKPESRKVCEKLKQMVEDPRYSGKTFGVISLLGDDQAKYIDSIIDEYLTAEEQDVHKYRAGDAYAFQGDERDIMLLSMVVGSDDEKRLTALTSDVFRQRFNVAVSRARDKLILFHSVRLEDLKNEDLRYKLLNFVQNRISPAKEKEKVKGLFESPFEEAVYVWLTDRGYSVTPQVSVGAKRIDLVVEGVNARLGVECYGDKFHPPEKWWEDRVRVRQLERAGWKICWVWASAFYCDQDSAMEDVLSNIQKLGIRPNK